MRRGAVARLSYRIGVREDHFSWRENSRLLRNVVRENPMEYGLGCSASTEEVDWDKFSADSEVFRVCVPKAEDPAISMRPRGGQAWALT